MAAGWIVDVMILPAFRGHALGHRLYEGAAKSGLALVTLTMALPTTPHGRTPRRHRAPDDAAMVADRGTKRTRRLSLSGREDNLPAKLGARGEAREPPRRVVGARICAARAGVRNRLSPPDVAGGYVFTPVERFDERIDTVWASVQDRFAGVPRTAGISTGASGSARSFATSAFRSRAPDTSSAILCFALASRSSCVKESSSTRWRLTTTRTCGGRSSPIRAGAFSGRRRA